RILLERSGQAQEVPDTGQPLAAGWLPAVAGAALALLTGADPKHADLSYTGAGRTDLYLGRHGNDALYLRVQASNQIAPRTAGDKTAVLTLTGTALLEGYTDQAHIDSNEPQYVREFRPESIYFCYPGTPYAVELSSDACQLVVSRGPLARSGSQLTASEYLDGMKSAAELLTTALQPAQNRAGRLPASHND
ncbi:hypothetical protein, partial [Kitasatospora sp. GP82]|uniref:hypothetical protein n=1 Tax=Kitasatospora sp. GP82 TaxID=3035089 RepID=UPI002476F0DF